MTWTVEIDVKLHICKVQIQSLLRWNWIGYIMFVLKIWDTGNLYNFPCLPGVMDYLEINHMMSNFDTNHNN